MKDVYIFSNDPTSNLCTEFAQAIRRDHDQINILTGTFPTDIPPLGGIAFLERYADTRAFEPEAKLLSRFFDATFVLQSVPFYQGQHLQIQGWPLVGLKGIVTKLNIGYGVTEIESDKIKRGDISILSKYFQ